MKTIKIKKINKAKPFIKWVGGKMKIMDKVIDNIPKKFNNYYEPFVGGGSVLLNMPFKNKALINDFNSDLIDLYKIVKTKPNELIKKLKSIQNKYNNLKSIDDKKDFFYKKRKQLNQLKKKNDSKSKIKRASLYIYINKSCFNGIMTTNKSKELRPSFGYHNKVNLLNNDNILKVSKILKKTIIHNKDYIEIINKAQKGDFVYLDPPYVPDDITECNIKYNDGKSWGIKDFDTFFDNFEKLDKRGVFIMMSNSHSKYVLKRYKNTKFNILKVPIIRTVSVNKKTRGIKYEVIITNYKIKKNKTRKKSRTKKKSKSKTK